MNARYMDFKNVSTSVTNMISDVLVSEPKSVGSVPNNHIFLSDANLSHHQIENFRKMAEMKSKLDKKGGGVLSIEEDLTTAEAQLILVGDLAKTLPPPLFFAFYSTCFYYLIGPTSQASATEEKEAVVLQQRKQSVQIPRSFVISGNRTKERYDICI